MCFDWVCQYLSCPAPGRSSWPLNNGEIHVLSGFFAPNLDASRCPRSKSELGWFLGCTFVGYR